MEETNNSIEKSSAESETNNDIKVIVEETKQEEKIDAESIKEISPAQCFIDGIAMTVAFFPEVEVKPSTVKSGLRTLI